MPSTLRRVGAATVSLPLSLSACLASALAATLLVPASARATTPTGDPTSTPTHTAHVCDAPAPGHAACSAEVLVSGTGTRVDPMSVAASPWGLDPQGLRDAYGLTGRSGSGRTVAIIGAYGYPTVERDLAVYRAQYGLPSCSSSNGCLTVVNQVGALHAAPRFDPAWAVEQALDVDAVSATCPDCRILLVQANSSKLSDLGEAVVTASRHAGVVAISNSYVASDQSDATYGAFYNRPGIAITAATGDFGHQGPAYPASSRYVVAVGGTSLWHDGSQRGWSESAWSGSGSGCSLLNSAPNGQGGAATRCGGRAVADVSAVADPATGLAVYAPLSDTVSGWSQYGGTSLAAPIVASVFALAGRVDGYAPDRLYADDASAFNDVVTGGNGGCADECTAAPGWDGPTGLGTPRGITGF